MSITASVSNDGKTVNITIGEKFDFSIKNQFSKAYKFHKPSGQLFRIDFRQTVYIDSAALGMLLQLKEYAEGNGGEVVLCHPKGMAKEILNIAHFEDLFTIEM